MVEGPLVVSFKHTPEEARQAVEKFYGKRWFGASTSHIDIGVPDGQWLPFYGCDGTVTAQFNAQLQYRTTRTGSDGKMHTDTHHRTVGPYTMSQGFHSNSVLVYAGFQHNKSHLKKVVTPEVVINAHSPFSADFGQHAIHLFEMTTNTVKDEIIHDVLHSQLEAEAKRVARSENWSGDINSISWLHRSVHLHRMQPFHIPVYSVPMKYDGEDYRVIVGGANLSVQGPYLLNAQLFARMSSCAVLIWTVAVAPSIGGLILGLMLAGGTNVAADKFARALPTWLRNRDRKAREEAIRKNSDYTNMGDINRQSAGDYHFGFRNAFRSEPSSQFREENRWGSTLHNEGSTYKTNVGREFEDFNFNPGNEFERRRRRYDRPVDTIHDADPNLPRDPKGYYRTLELRGDESKSEVQSQYRRLIMKYHPDNTRTGDNAKMVQINDAYRVIRDAERRARYDQL